MSEQLARTLATLFTGLQPAEVERLASRGSVKRLMVGERLFSAEDAADEVYCIVAGRLAVHLDSGFGAKTTVVALLGNGTIVGEGAAAGEKGRGATLIAVEESILAVLARSELAKLEVEEPAVALVMMKKFLALASFRLQKSSERLALVL